MNKKKVSNEHVQVYVRCRPLLPSELNVPIPVEVHPQVNKILIRETALDKCAVKTFSFDKVFGPETKQADIYSAVVAPRIREVIMGFNCTIFAYGQTGTGKTFTIEGGRTRNMRDPAKDPLPGIIPRSLKHLFNDLSEVQTEYEILVSFLELYNEEIYDLLSKPDDLVKLKMFDNSSQKGSVIVHGLQTVPVKSIEDIYTILDKGCKKRRKAATLLNKLSSRSHTVFTITVNIKQNSSTFEKTKTGKLNLVDLAGSENIGRSGAMNARAREAGNINQSLLALGRVINSLYEKAGHIPYRESKLTRLLQDSLGGQTKTTVIATISPSGAHIDETLNTLEYALRAKSVTNKPELNTQMEATALTKDYLEEKNRLKKAIRELGINEYFYVPEEDTRRWESTLVSKREENYDYLCQIELLLKESESLDACIIEASHTMDDKKKKIVDAKSKTEDWNEMLLKETQDCKKYKAMLSIMQPMYDDLHENFHKVVEKKTFIETEVMKIRKKADCSNGERRYLHAKIKILHINREQTNNKIRNCIEELSKNIKIMHSKTSETSFECNGFISTLKSGFHTTANICDNGFDNLNKAVSDLETLNNVFKENVEAYIGEQKCAKAKWLDDFQASQATSSDARMFDSAFDSLNKIFSDCKTSIQGIVSSWKDWKSYHSSKMNLLEDIVNKYVENQNASLQSTTRCMNMLLKQQKENLEAYYKIISECVKLDNSNKKLWDKYFFAVENAIYSLDVFCTEHIKMKVDMATQAQKYFRNYSEFGQEMTDQILSYCEASSKNFDTTRGEIDIRAKDISRSILNDVKFKVETSLSKYKDFDSELADYSNACQNSTVQLENKMTDEQHCRDNCNLLASFQEMCDSLSKLKNFSKVVLEENMSKIDVCVSEEKTVVNQINESSKILPSIQSNISEYIKEIEDNMLKYLSNKELQTVNDGKKRNEDTLNGQITVGTLDEDATLNFKESMEETFREYECPFCANKIEDETLQQHDRNDTATSFFGGNKITSTPKPIPGASASNTAVSYLQKSPTRPALTKFSCSKSLKFTDIESFSRHLWETSNDDE